MKKYVVMELWGSLFSDDLQFEAKTRREAIKMYLVHREMPKARVVYDSIKNHIQDSSRVICIQEGHYEGDIKYIRGKRGFYKVIQ